MLNVPILNISVTPHSAKQVVDRINLHAARGERLLIVGHNLHSAYMYKTDQRFKQVYDCADLILIDGQPLRFSLNVFGKAGLTQEYRVGSVDWLTRASEFSFERLAIIGASEASNELTQQVLSASSSCVVRGWPGANWSNQDHDHIFSEVAQFNPDLLLVGLGMPMQEHIYETLSAGLPNCIIALVGGAIDQLNGTQERAPKAFQRAGLEWFWRLIRDPRKFAGRYLVEPFKLFFLIMKGN